MLWVVFHRVGVWRNAAGIGDVVTLGVVDAPRGVEGLGGGAVGGAVHRGPVVVLGLIHG